MKKQLFLWGALLLAAPCAIAQNSSHPAMEDAPAERIDQSLSAPTHVDKAKKASVSAAALWSQNFATGIPSTWTNQGYDENPATGALTPNPLNLWEYRGPNTTPSNAIGSRGRLAGSGPIIQAPTSANGFLIYDSDYLDSDGTVRGAGVSPAPHLGTLSTDTIDLTGNPYVQVVMFSRARKYGCLYKLAVSNDGGVTFPDTAEFHPSLAVNATSSSGSEISANISNTAGNQAMVVLRLIFDGRPSGGGSGSGLYYWQIDDMEIREIPAHSLKFTTYRNAPARDIIYPPNGPEYGNPQVDQVQPITFDCNAYNFGVLDQGNVRLKVTIKDPTNTVISTLTSAAIPNLPAGDTGTFNTLATTSSWTPPPTLGAYTVIYALESDSIPIVEASPKDSVVIRVNQQIHGGHFNVFNNDIGTQQDRIALGQVFTFPNSHPDTSGYILLDGVNMRISADSDTTGLVVVEVYDTAGFTYGANGGPAGNPLIGKPFALSASTVGTWAFVDFRAADSIPIILPSNTGFYVVLSLLPNAAGGIVQIGNDQTITQPNGMIAMQRNDGTWFSGYSNSNSLSNLLVEMVVSEGFVGIEEVLARQNWFSIYPQPAPADRVQMEITQGGNYTLEVYTLNGKKVHEEEFSVNGPQKMLRDFSSLAKGSYLVSISGEGGASTKKLILE